MSDGNREAVPASDAVSPDGANSTPVTRQVVDPVYCKVTSQLVRATSRVLAYVRTVAT